MQREVERFFLRTASSPLSDHHAHLRHALKTHVRRHGRNDEWKQALESVVPDSAAGDFSSDIVRIGNPESVHTTVLKQLMPWRKGPFQVGVDFVDTEWRSDWKWQRVLPHLRDLSGVSLLDVGCGNGYHLLRALGEGADLALGVDPTILFNYQFALLQRISADNRAFLLPLKSEHLPAFNCFDIVMSMGVLYHRRSARDHIRELVSFLKPGGQLVMETLVVEGDAGTTLVPEGRYAKMGNVWVIPSTGYLEAMLKQEGLMEVVTVDVTVTTTDEQRPTEWMDFESLPDFLDPNDPTKTIEGYPAPCRAVLTAIKAA